jgi:hypothetical protein
MGTTLHPWRLSDDQIGVVKFEKSLDVEWSRPSRQNVMMSMQGIAEIPRLHRSQRRLNLA